MRTETKLSKKLMMLASGAVLALAVAACASSPAGDAESGSTASAAPANDLSASSLEMGDPEALGFDTAKLDEIRAAYEADIESGKLPGAYLLIGRHDKVAFAEGFGVQGPDQTTPMSDETIFRVFSMTKPIVTVTAMKLVEEGKLNIDDPVSKYIPEFADATVYQQGQDPRPANGEMKVRNLMSHTSGLIYGGLIRGSHPLAQMYAQAGAAGGGALGNPTTLEVAKAIGGLPLIADPGTAWNYSYSTDVLGAVVEVASGQLLSEAVEQRVTGPLGMTDTMFFQPQENSGRFAQSKDADNPIYYDYTATRNFLSGGGGLSSTPEDYLRFTLMLANDGEYRGVRILKKETLMRMRQDETTQAIRDAGIFFPAIAPAVRGSMGFGLGFSLVLDDTRQRPGEGTFSWYGIGGTEFWVDPKNDIFMVFGIQDASLTAEYQRKNRDFIYDAFVGD